MSRTVITAALIAIGVLIGAVALTRMGKPAPKLSAQDLARHIEILASDAFEGRAPGTAGEEQTIRYIAGEYRRLGLVPGVGDSYFQPVPLVESTARNISPLMVTGAGEPLLLAVDDDVVVWTKQVVERARLFDSDMVFVGYGIVAPEYGWDDYAGVDVAGKTVLVLVNDPGFATGDPDLFNGRSMTYYGRWTYKFEEAARQGAAAALIVHETAPAAYPWSVVTGSWTGPQIDMARDDAGASRLQVEGWITGDAAARVLAAAGQDLGALKTKALSRGAAPVPLGLSASISFDNAIRQSTSNNVVGIVEGKRRPEEAIIYMAHWDHLGRGPAVDGDDIYNGALDNATGVAGLIELAEQFAKGARPDRSVVFLALTAEESGLLGSAWYAANPIVPPGQTVAAFNMDGLNILGPARDVAVVGSGKSELEGYLERAAKRQGRIVVADPEPEKGYFYRSDHFNFAKVGIPVLYASSGYDDRARGAQWGRTQAEAYIAQHYHQPSDEYDPAWDLTGAVEDLALLHQIGREIANSNAWPNWYEGDEFRAARDATRPANSRGRR